MSRRATVWSLALLVGIVLLGLLLGLPEPGASSSALSAGPRGWLAARRYLEARGVRVTLADVPLQRLLQETMGGEPRPVDGAVWVLAFPWQALLGDGELFALRSHLRAGGTVLFAYSQTLGQFQEEQVMEELALATRVVRDPPPLAPWRWWTYQRESWTLAPAGGWSGRGGVPEVVVPAAQAVPRAPAGATAFYHVRAAGAEVPVVFSYRLHRGRVIALPAAVFANAHLQAAGHADLLESLRRWLGDAWSFDEYHHGLASAALAAGGTRFAWDLFMLHLAVFYVLGLLALARRFGPPWREAAVAAGSTAAFLRNLGALHRELGHHQAAARLLIERTRELDPSRPAAAVPEVDDDARLVALARRVTLAPTLRRSP